jgi:aminoglycoside N3'-acetyltransferase
MSISTALLALGVRRGDLLTVHASMRAIGPVDGGAAAVLDQIFAAIGPEGTVMMTMYGSGEPFDALRTPADPEIGVLAEVFRTYPGTVVSDHPEGRFGANGRLAEALVRDVPWNDYYGAGSPLDRFVEHGGKVLRLGADLDTVTLIHLAEHRLVYPHKRRRQRRRTVVTATGVEERIIDTLDDSDNIVDLPGEDYFARIIREYLASGAASQATVGNARAELIDGADLVEFSVRWMERHFPPVDPA